MTNERPEGRFARFARTAAAFAGRPLVFGAAVLLVVVWLASGPMLGFNSTWQLMINTATTVLTFLMVFLIQNTQHRDAEAMHLKLDELLHAIDGTREDVIDAERASDKDIEEREAEYAAIAERAHRRTSERR